MPSAIPPAQREPMIRCCSALRRALRTSAHCDIEVVGDLILWLRLVAAA
jgi:hypothetical protein